MCLIMAVLVQDEGVQILEYEIKEGNSIQFRVGGTVEAFMQRIGPAPDGDMFMDAAASQHAERVTIEYEHALAGPQKKVSWTRQASYRQSCDFSSLEDDRTELGVNP